VDKSLVISPEVVAFDLIRSSINGFLSWVKADSSGYKKTLLDTFVDHIELDNDEVIIYFKFYLEGLSPDNSFMRSRTQVSTCVKKLVYLVLG